MSLPIGMSIEKRVPLKNRHFPRLLYPLRTRILMYSLIHCVSARSVCPRSRNNRIVGPKLLTGFENHAMVVIDIGKAQYLPAGGSEKSPAFKAGESGAFYADGYRSLGSRTVDALVRQTSNPVSYDKISS